VLLAIAWGVALGIGGAHPGNAEPPPSLDEAYRALGARQTHFQPVPDEFLPSDAAFLSSLFTGTDEAVVLNVWVARWFESQGEEGLHFEDYHARIDPLLERLAALDPPPRAVPTRDLVSAALRLQRDFLTEWGKAVVEERPFESQLTSEYGFHDGLHQSRRKLLQAYAELHALYPDASEQAHRAFHDHLRALAIQ
jgi:hypothetical protein